MARLVKRLTSALVAISQFVGLGPASGSVLMAQGPEPASDSVSPLSLCSSPAHVLSLSLALSFPLSKTKLKTKEEKFKISN